MYSEEELNNELWRPIADYDNYQVSTLGRVFNKKFQRIIKPFNHKCGYDLVDLNKNGKGKTYTVHRLVMNAFIPNVDCKPHIDHIDWNKKNNRLSNLRWATHSENICNTNRVILARMREGRKRFEKEFKRLAMIRI